MNKLILLITALAFSATSWAADWYPSSELTQKDKIEFEPLQCPTIGKDYALIIGQLQSLQDSIKKDANCGQLKKNLEKIGLLTGDRRKEFLGTIEKIRKGEALSDAEMQKKIIGYVEDITVATGTLGVMLTSGDQCFGEKDPTTALTALSSFVNEASTLLGTVGGPWGSALAIAGKISAGFLTGVGKFIASRPGYKFYDNKDWQGYVESLCAFHEQQAAIESLLHPDQIINSLNRIEIDLQNQLTIMQQSIPQSEALIQNFNAQNNAGLVDISAEINDFTDSNAGNVMIQILSAQRWLKIRIEKIIAEANDPLAPSKKLVQDYRDEIEEFMIDKQGPLFVQFQEKETRTALKDLYSLINYEGTRIYQQMQALNTPKLKEPRRSLRRGTYPDSENVLKAILDADEYDFFDKGELGAQLASSIVYFKREVSQKWDAVNINNDTKKSFCTFFERAGYLNMPLRNSCYSRRGQAIDEEIVRYEGMGLSKSIPAYISRSKRYKGNSWTETLGFWAQSL